MGTRRVPPLRREVRLEGGFDGGTFESVSRLNRARLRLVRPPLAALAPLLAALAWVITLTVDPDPFAAVPSALLLGIGILVMATVATTGLVVLGARWAHRLGWIVVAVGAVIAAARPVDAAWIGALAVTALAAAAMVSVQGRVRKLPSATGPPTRAVLLPLVHLGAPVALGLASAGDTWAVLVVSITAMFSGFLYSRVVWGGLFVSRVAWPVLALGLMPFLDSVGVAVTAILVATTLVLAWHPSTKAAFHPPRTVGTTFAIPPELAPGDILDAAGLDERGRRKP